MITGEHGGDLRNEVLNVMRISEMRMMDYIVYVIWCQVHYLQRASTKFLEFSNVMPTNCQHDSICQHK